MFVYSYISAPSRDVPERPHCSLEQFRVGAVVGDGLDKHGDSIGVAELEEKRP